MRWLTYDASFPAQRVSFKVRVQVGKEWDPATWWRGADEAGDTEFSNRGGFYRGSAFPPLCLRELICMVCRNCNDRPCEKDNVATPPHTCWGSEPRVPHFHDKNCT